MRLLRHSRGNPETEYVEAYPTAPPLDSTSIPQGRCGHGRTALADPLPYLSSRVQSTLYGQIKIPITDKSKFLSLTMIDEGDGSYTIFFTGGTHENHFADFRAVGMVKVKLVEEEL